jgi:hypothetical protein
MAKIPKRKDRKLRDHLLTEIHAHGGEAVAEDLRPAVGKALRFTPTPQQQKNWKDTVSWALIDLRDEELVDSPFGEPNSPGNRKWILVNRPGRDLSQQVWRLTRTGHQYVIDHGLAVSHLADDVNKSQGAFDPTDNEDARERIKTMIVARRGQQKFRNHLLTLYQNKCAITGTVAKDVLEAAHIIPFKGPKTNHLSNGLLLRSDVHTLFDLRLIAVDTRRMTVLVSPRLKGTDYANYVGRSLNLPKDRADWPSVDALDMQREEAGL